jgi:hypothetical protein
MDVAEKNFNAHKTACCSHENAYPYNRNDDPHTDVSLTSLNLFCECTDTTFYALQGVVGQFRRSASLHRVRLESVRARRGEIHTSAKRYITNTLVLILRQIQVAEHPSLGHLKEALYSRTYQLLVH